jgi:hypothetical protein
VIAKDTERKNGSGRRCRGKRVQGLVYYLFGPGRHEEHKDPHVVAAWDPSWVQIGRLDRSEQYRMAAEMDAPRRLSGVEKPKGHVMHLALSTDPTERRLSDDEWSLVARDLLHELGLTEDPETGRVGAPWAVIRHADNHVHVAVVLCRENGVPVAENELRQSYNRMREVVERWENTLGLRQTGRGAGTRGQSRAEYERAHAGSGAERVPERVRLARVVRTAAVQAKNEADFVDRVRDAGVVIRPRWAEGGKRTVTGYSVACPAEKTDGTWVRFGGGRLARDLTLPALRARWDTPTTGDQQAAVAAWRNAETGKPHGVTQRPHDTQMWAKAGEVLGDVHRQLGGVAPTDFAAWSTAASDTSGTLAAVAARLEPDGSGPLSQAADSMAAAAQTTSRPYQRPDMLRKTPGVARVASGAMIASRGGTAATRVLLAQLGRTIRAIEAANRAADRAQHALVAARAAEQVDAYLRQSQGIAPAAAGTQPTQKTTHTTVRESPPVRPPQDTPRRPQPPRRTGPQHPRPRPREGPER